MTINLNHSADIELLDNQVLPFAHHLTEEHNIPILIFQEDNSHIHRAAIVTDWHEKHSGVFTHLDWPATSPDLNPLENL